MGFVAITMDRYTVYFYFSIAVKRKRIIFTVFTDIFQCCNNLECRSRRIQPLRCAVQQYSGTVIGYDVVPVILNRIRVKVRFGYHGKNLAGGRLKNDHCATFIPKGITGGFLDFIIQSCNNRISLIFLIFQIIDQLLCKKRM